MLYIDYVLIPMDCHYSYLIIYRVSRKSVNRLLQIRTKGKCNTILTVDKYINNKTNNSADYVHVSFT